MKVTENQGYGDIKPVLRDHARKGCDLIISRASGYQTVTPEVVKERDIRVAVVENPTAVREGLVASYEGEAKEGAYLARIIAAHMTRLNVVGCVTSVEVPNWNRMTEGINSGRIKVSTVADSTKMRQMMRKMF